MKESLPSGYLLFQRYSIQAVLGQGGYGITYLAYDVKLDTEVAVKELFLSGGSVRSTDGIVHAGQIGIEVFAGFVKRFTDEAKSLARFNHPGIVRVLDVFEANGTAYLVMEYVVGKTLKAYVGGAGPLESGFALKLFQQVIEAVAVVHGQNMLHRDIKPDNIMVTADERIVLIDFGAARDISANAPNIHSIMLTPGFAPLEQYSEHGQRGAFTDVYALGATLYFMLTGAKPLAATDRLLQEMKSPREVVGSGISSSVSQAVMRAMAELPEDRFQTLGAFRDALYLPKGDVQEKEDFDQAGKRFKETRTSSRTSLQRHPLRFAVLAVFFVGLGWVGLMYLTSSLHPAVQVHSSHTVEENRVVVEGNFEGGEVRSVTLLFGKNRSLDSAVSQPAQMVGQRSFSCEFTVSEGGREYWYVPMFVLANREHAYGDTLRVEVPFVCGLDAVEFDGYPYSTVKIGSQCWFNENLRTTRYRGGDAIPGDLSDSEWTSTTEGAQTVYGEGWSEVYAGSVDESDNLATYGRLYNWYAVNDSRGLCPAGWHVPSDAEWKELEMALGMTQAQANEEGFRGDDIGAQLKMPSWGGTNSSGFSALPGGYRYSDFGGFDSQGSNGGWWSSSPSGTDAWYRYLYSGYSSVYRDYTSTRFGFSVRCVRD